jgi:membrane protein
MDSARSRFERSGSGVAQYRLRTVNRLVPLPALMTSFVKATATLLWRAANNWVDHRCDSQAAAVAFYALFSLAPMLVLVVAIAGLALDAAVVSEKIFVELRGVVGASAAEAVRATVTQARLSEWSRQATIASIVVTIIGASATFAELKAALNGILGYQREASVALSKITWTFVKARLLSAALVAGIGFLLIGSLVLDALLSLVSSLTEPLFASLRLDVLVSAIVLALAFAVLLRVLPDVHVRWRDALRGGFVAAVLFSVGKFGFAYYLSAAGTANAFGAAGSVAVTLMWLFYSAAVFFYGAEIVLVCRDGENLLAVPDARKQRQ